MSAPLSAETKALIDVTAGIDDGRLASAYVKSAARNGGSGRDPPCVTSGRAQFGPPGYELDLLYLACLAALVFGGSGPMAIDGLLRKWRKGGHSFLDQSH